MLPPPTNPPSSGRSRHDLQLFAKCAAAFSIEKQLSTYRVRKLSPACYDGPPPESKQARPVMLMFVLVLVSTTPGHVSRRGLEDLEGGDGASQGANGFLLFSGQPAGRPEYLHHLPKPGGGTRRRPRPQQKMRQRDSTTFRDLRPRRAHRHSRS